MTLLKARQIKFGYSHDKALGPLDLEIHSGEIHLVFGANGAGKTALLKTLAGVLPAVLGSIEYSHRPSLLLPSTEFYPGLTGYDVLDICRVPAYSVQTILDRLQLEGLLKLKIDNFSSGEKQRLLLSVALGRNTDLVILDEPLSFLDLNFASVFHDLLTEQAAAGRGLLASFHDPQSILKFKIPRIILLSQTHPPMIGDFKTLLSQGSFERALNVKISVEKSAVDNSSFLKISSIV